MLLVFFFLVAFTASLSSSRAMDNSSTEKERKWNLILGIATINK